MGFTKTAPKIGENRGNAGKGRPRGSPNKATAEIKELAREYTAEALEALVAVMREGPAAARVAAVKEIFDRGYGKATQLVDANLSGGGVSDEMKRWLGIG